MEGARQVCMTRCFTSAMCCSPSLRMELDNVYSMSSLGWRTGQEASALRPAAVPAPGAVHVGNTAGDPPSAATLPARRNGVRSAPARRDTSPVSNATSVWPRPSRRQRYAPCA